MSLHDKLKRAASKGAQEAAMRERARCLWILDHMVTETERNLAKKVLIERERQIAQVKLEIMKSLASRLKMKILTGAAPFSDEFEEDYIECELCLDKGVMYHKGQRLCQGCYDAKRQDAVD